jgi:hypothetical protein
MGLDYGDSDRKLHYPGGTLLPHIKCFQLIFRSDSNGPHVKHLFLRREEAGAYRCEVC